MTARDARPLPRDDSLFPIILILLLNGSNQVWNGGSYAHLSCAINNGEVQTSFIEIAGFDFLYLRRAVRNVECDLRHAAILHPWCDGESFGGI
jgi:hypothetical protein